VESTGGDFSSSFNSTNADRIFFPMLAIMVVLGLLNIPAC
jgi:hypothetical protein